MNTSKLQNLFGFIFAALCLVVMPLQANAKSAKAKAGTASQQMQKERLVLMPLRVGDELQSMQGAMESALVDGLQQKYTVMWGEEVEKKASQIFHKENLKHECNEERCMQGIAEAFQSELLATANVTKQEGGYVVILTIQNLFDHIVVFTRPLQCKGCDSFAVVDKLRELGVAAAPVAAAPVTTAAEPPQPKVNQNDPEAVLWAEVQKGNTADDYQVYINTYPKGKYLPLAKARIKKLKDEALAAAEQQEQSAWDTAQQGGSEGSYVLYLKGYPNGRFAGLAKVRMDKLKNDVAAREEAELWKKADSNNDKSALETYISKYPTGHYISAANTKLKSMQASSEIKQQSKAEDDLWNKADSSNSKEIIEIYLHRYPSGRYVANAKAKLKVFNGDDGISRGVTQLSTSKQNESPLNGEAASPDVSVNLDAVPDAVPKAEPLHRYANREYTALGKTYKPLTVTGTYIETGIASWYGKKFHGQRTSIGETYDMYGMTAAHTTLPVPSYARVTNVATKKSVVVRINDRGPFLPDRIIDLSYAAAYKLGVINVESANVLVESIAVE